MLELPIGVAFSDERTVYEALFVALVVSYGRVFMSSNTTDKQYKDSVSNSYGTFRAEVIKSLEVSLQKQHERIMQKRHTAIAHSDAISRNYKHYNNSPLGIGCNPYYPYEHDEVEKVLELVEILIGAVGAQQSAIGKIAFEKPLF